MSGEHICRYCTPFSEWHFEHAADPDCIVGVVTVDDARAQRIRDIVAQQWAVAMALLTPQRMIDLATGERFMSWCIWHPLPKGRRRDIEAIAALPSAAEIVGGEP